MFPCSPKPWDTPTCVAGAVVLLSVVCVLFKISSSLDHCLFFRIADVYCPILILHDRDDHTLSIELGKKVNKFVTAS